MLLLGDDDLALPLLSAEETTGAVLRRGGGLDAGK